MTPAKTNAVLLIPLLVAFSPHALPSPSASPVRISGSTTVNPVVAEAAEHLREARGMRLRTDTSGGSSGGINALGDGRADIAMSSRPLNERDRRVFPDTDFRPVRIGEDIISIIVSRDVHLAGIRSIDKTRMRGIYEKTIRNWETLGGRDRRIVFFNKEPGRGTRQVFLEWLYGGPDNAPRVSHPEVGANAEVRSKVARTPGALSFVSSAWVDERTIFPLALRNADGESPADTATDGEQPLVRPLYLITDGEPRGGAAILIDYLLSENGQALVRKHGYRALEGFRDATHGPR